MARRHGIRAIGSDIVDHGTGQVADFFDLDFDFPNIVTNPPFKLAEQFYRHARDRTAGKTAMIFPVARLNAAKWVRHSSMLRRIWLLSPRPSMPPGEVILSGGKISGGKEDYCWLVFFDGTGFPEVRWLHRDSR
jgi:hypothetical protein